MQATVSSAFIWRRVHSLMGLWLVVYLCEHLLVNSQAALWLSQDGHGFVRLVNSLESLPFLPVIEIVLIGIPLAIHMIWGVYRAWQARCNSASTDGSKPSLGSYGRNRAYTWQRLTSWILLVGIVVHVVQMRFLRMPEQTAPAEWTSEIALNEESLLLAERMQVKVEKTPSDTLRISAPTIGGAMLFSLRDLFKHPWQAIWYSIFVCAAAFHAFNGFWTFLITWGDLLSYRSQKAMIPVGAIGMAILIFLGFAAIWGSYFV